MKDEFWNNGMFEEREAMLEEIKRRLIVSDIFYTDIWHRVLQTPNSILREILDSDFEKKVLAVRKHAAPQ